MTRIERSFPEGRGPHTPWGAAQCASEYGPGITFYSTASHGGFHVAPERLHAMPPALRSKGGWYEEDSEWCKVAIAFPDLFTPADMEHAHKTFREWCWEEWEQHYGRALQLGESYCKDHPIPVMVRPAA